MDLGIAGKRALVSASSQGLGFGCAQALAKAGVDLVICARSSGPLEQARQALEQHGVSVTAVAGDVTTDDGRTAVLDAAGQVDILVTNAGGPPPGHWSDWERTDFISAIDSNMLTPIMLMKALLPGMIENKWGRVVNITSQFVKGPSSILGLSNSARAGLTGYVAGTSRDVAKHGVTINNLLPGLHSTNRSESLDVAAAEKADISVAEAKAARCETIPAGRYGTVEEFGNTCAFLCSQHAGFIVGQNVLLDGGYISATI
ncbi:3-oxoacyl-ACP reductase [Amylibacter marinus]|uniref:3-oxoacyl-ACP reductase n=1 Tax=Amylibacter marinus TaxID=1475483 RepID=A0ABQ5VUA6_9RHOB|nr:SDR family oxidoreductase [Amylibacter marinus]GLQ34757.1 3-oxoacyl-ACP reductase [Amylibacter marinus]